ncbi:MAG: anti-sigma factor [Chloroflexi bacterium]|nr:anti-sigma factor [Chloroflexota bacterium]MBI2983306.1 anti-sigma factor [Chloroflexota bacterium]
MTHVLDDLELYAVGALPADRSDAVAAHLRGCASCRAAAGEIAEVVAALADTVPLREPPADLKDRILAAAAEDVRRQRRAVRLPRIPLDPRMLAMAAAIVLLLGFDANQTLRLQAVQAERDEYERGLANVALGGRTWYMAGVDQWKGSGGNLMQPASGKPAFVVFHDLRPLDQGQLYALWLIAPDGKWVRGASFRPDAERIQMVEIGQELAGFERCAVTVETSSTGKREGPVVMQSRIAPPSQ